MARFVPNPAFKAEIQAEPPFKKGIAGITTGTADAIRVAAQPFRHTGYFISKIRSTQNRIVFGDPFWHLSEYGSVNNPPQANARRGVTAAGLRFEDDGPKQAA